MKPQSFQLKTLSVWFVFQWQNSNHSEIGIHHYFNNKKNVNHLQEYLHNDFFFLHSDFIRIPLESPLINLIIRISRHIILSRSFYFTPKIKFPTQFLTFAPSSHLVNHDLLISKSFLGFHTLNFKTLDEN